MSHNWPVSLKAPLYELFRNFSMDNFENFQKVTRKMMENARRRPVGAIGKNIKVEYLAICLPTCLDTTGPRMVQERLKKQDTDEMRGEIVGPSSTTNDLIIRFQVYRLYLSWTNQQNWWKSFLRLL